MSTLARITVSSQTSRRVRRVPIAEEKTRPTCYQTALPMCTIYLPAAQTFQGVDQLRHQSGDPMYSSRFRILLILTFVLISAAVAHARPSEPGRSKSRQNQSVNATHADPCWTSSAEKVMPSVAPWRAQINRRTAIRLRACPQLADSQDVHQVIHGRST